MSFNGKAMKTYLRSDEGQRELQQEQENRIACDDPSNWFFRLVIGTSSYTYCTSYHKTYKQAKQRLRDYQYMSHDAYPMHELDYVFVPPTYRVDVWYE